MKTFTFRPARLEDIPALVALEEEVEKCLPSRDMFAIDGPEFYTPILAGAGHILLAFDNTGLLAGVNVLRYPAVDDSENLGHNIGLAPSELARVRHMESIFLRPDCQGYGLAYTLQKEAMRLWNGDGKDISLATVWPCNVPSLTLFFRLGFSVRAFAYKYGGKPRFILMQTSESLPLDKSVTYALATDFDEHCRLLALGMVGTCIKREGESILIGFQRILEPHSEV